MRLKRVMNIGMSGDDVTLLQEKLKNLGFFKDRIDGYFGQNTLLAVTSLQKSVGVRPDGNVGTQTWSQIVNYGLKRKSEEVETPVIDTREANRKHAKLIAASRIRNYSRFMCASLNAQYSEPQCWPRASKTLAQCH